MNDVNQNEGVPTGDERGQKSAGPVIGIIIIVLVLVFGGLYFWGKRVTQEPTPEAIMNMPDSQLETLGTQNTSDEVTAIEEDLNATDLENLDAELGDIEKELGNF